MAIVFGLGLLGALTLLVAGPGPVGGLCGGLTPAQIVKARKLLGLLAVFASLGLLAELTGNRFRYPLIFGLGACLVIMGSDSELGQDLISHLFKAGEVAKGLARGGFNLYVSRDIAGSGGLPVFVYYSSWLYYPAAISKLLGCGLFLGMKLTLVLFFVLLGIGMYRLLRLFGNREAAAAGVLFFLTSNYILGNFLARLALAEVAAMTALSYGARYLIEVLRRPTRIRACWAVLFSTLVLIFHPLTFMNFMPALLLLLLTGFGTGEGKPGFGRRLFLLAGISLGCLFLASFRWVPILWESRYIYLHHHGVVHFYPEFLSFVGYLKPVFFTAPGIMQVCFLVLAVFLFFRKRFLGENARFAAVRLFPVIIVYVLLTVPVSGVVWDNSDFLQGNQFPWRMLGPLVFFLALLFVGTANDNATLISWFRPLLLLQGMVLLVSYQHNIGGIDPGESLGKKVEDYARRREGWGIDEFMLRPGSFPSLGAAEISGTADIVTRKVEGERESLLVNSPLPGTWVEVARFWNPRYSLAVNDRPCPVRASPRGFLVVPLPSGESKVEIVLGKPAYVLLPEIVSLGVLLLFLGWTFRGGCRRKERAGAARGLCPDPGKPDSGAGL